MLKLILIGAGGFCGAILRYLGAGLGERLGGSALLPYGTMTVNLLGCVGIGLVAGLAEHRGLFSDNTREFLTIGLLGGFTTFSAFGHETYELFRGGQTTLAATNVLLQVAAGIAGVWLGHSLTRLT